MRWWLALLTLACASAPPPAPPPPPPAAPVVAQPPKPLPTTLLPGVGMSAPAPPADVDEEDEAAGPPPACAKDEDCWSKTCCAARAPEECVHASRARRCAIIEVQCKPTPIRYTCICDAGSCRGRLAPP